MQKCFKRCKYLYWFYQFCHLLTWLI